MTDDPMMKERLPETPAEIVSALRATWPALGHRDAASQASLGTRMQTLTTLRMAHATDLLAGHIDSNTDRFMKAFTNLQRVMDERAKELTAATNASAAQAERLGQIGIWITCAGVLLAVVEAIGAGRTMGWW
jgi:hypothetical protein